MESTAAVPGWGYGYVTKETNLVSTIVITRWHWYIIFWVKPLIRLGEVQNRLCMVI